MEISKRISDNIDTVQKDRQENWTVGMKYVTSMLAVAVLHSKDQFVAVNGCAGF